MASASAHQPHQPIDLSGLDHQLNELQKTISQRKPFSVGSMMFVMIVWSMVQEPLANLKQGLVLTPRDHEVLRLWRTIGINMSKMRITLCTLCDSIRTFTNVEIFLSELIDPVSSHSTFVNDCAVSITTFPNVLINAAHIHYAFNRDHSAGVYVFLMRIMNSIYRCIEHSHSILFINALYDFSILIMEYFVEFTSQEKSAYIQAVLASFKRTDRRVKSMQHELTHFNSRIERLRHSDDYDDKYLTFIEVAQLISYLECAVFDLLQRMLGRFLTQILCDKRRRRCGRGPILPPDLWQLLTDEFM